MASEDVLEAARNHATNYNRFERVFSEYQLAEARLIQALAAEVRELRKDRERLDYAIKFGLLRGASRSDIDAAMGEAKGE